GTRTVKSSAALAMAVNDIPLTVCGAGFQTTTVTGPALGARVQRTADVEVISPAATPNEKPGSPRVALVASRTGTQAAIASTTTASRRSTAPRVRGWADLSTCRRPPRRRVRAPARPETARTRRRIPRRTPPLAHRPWSSHPAADRRAQRAPRDVQEHA